MNITTDTLDPHFLAQVKDRTADARKTHDTFAQAFAHARGKRFTPMSFRDAVEKVIIEIMRGDGTAADRARAAAIYLSGKDSWWAIAPRDECKARAIVAEYYEKETDMPKPKHPKIERRARNNDDTKRHLAIMRASMELDYAMKHGANAAAKLDAIEAWFAAMAYLAPNELRASLMKARETANVCS